MSSAASAAPRTDTCYAVGGKFNDHHQRGDHGERWDRDHHPRIRRRHSLAHIVCIFGGKCLASGYTFSGPPDGLEATITNGKPGKPVIVSGTENLLRGAC